MLGLFLFTRFASEAWLEPTERANLGMSLFVSVRVDASGFKNVELILFARSVDAKITRL